MSIEIERKFLVSGDGWKAEATSAREIRQAYIAQGNASVRVRIVEGVSAMLTLKSMRDGEGRLEFEYGIPSDDAEALLALATGNVIAKRRHIVPATEQGLFWEVDVFEGRLAGLVVAEIELDRMDRTIALPDWVGREVTDDPRYYNERLSGEDRPPAAIGLQSS